MMIRQVQSRCITCTDWQVRLADMQRYNVIVTCAVMDKSNIDLLVMTAVDGNYGIPLEPPEVLQ